MNEYEYPPKGWMTVNAVKIKLNKNNTRKTSDKWLIKKIEDFLEDKTEEEKEKYYKKYLDKARNPNFHCSPELIKKLTELRNEYAPAPEGWMTVNALVGEMPREQKWIKKRIFGYINNLSEEETKIFYDKYLDASNRPRYHCSPELVKKLREISDQEDK